MKNWIVYFFIVSFTQTIQSTENLMQCQWETRFNPSQKCIADDYARSPGRHNQTNLNKLITNYDVSHDQGSNRFKYHDTHESYYCDNGICCQNTTRRQILKPKVDNKLFRKFNLYSTQREQLQTRPTSAALITSQTSKVKRSVDKSKGGVKDRRIVLNIIGLFAMRGEYPAGHGYLPAALFAVNVINKNSSMLPGYKLQLNVHDTRCTEEWALDGLYTELYKRKTRSIMTLGSTCSHVTETTAKVSNIWGMLQISYSAVSPHLSDKNIFPSFFRVTTPEQNLTNGRVELMRAMNWSRVHILYQNFKLFSTLNEHMVRDLKIQNISLESSIMFTTNPHRSVKQLMEKDARIIIGSFYEDMARKVMCAAYHIPGGEKWYKNTVWFLPSFLERGWMEVGLQNCTPDNIKQVVGQYFTIGSIVYNRDPTYQAVGDFSRDQFEDYTLYKEIKDHIPKEYQYLYSQCQHSPANCSLYAIHRAPEAFDAVWAIALALNNTLTYLKQNGDPRGLEDFDYGLNEMDLPCILREAMRNVTFHALCGPFHFNSHGEGSSKLAIVRYNNTGRYDFTHVGNCTVDDFDQWSCSIQKDIILWNTVDGKPPYDGIQTRNRKIEIKLCVLVTIISLAGLGILVCLCLLALNVWNRNHRIIKMSSPRLNNLILIGSVFGYINIILQDHGDTPEIPVCMIRLFAKPLGFCLVFGSLFAKTWRVYEIFTAGAHAYKLNKKILRDSSLLFIVGGLVVVNCALLASWIIVSPQEVVIANISITEVPGRSDLDVKYLNQFTQCSSSMQTEFTIAAIAIDGLVMMFGTFLAVQTRKVSYPEFNDSKLIAMAIYNVVVVEPVCVVMNYAIQDNPDLTYILYSLLQMIMSSVTLGLIFLPKIVSYRRHNKQRKQLLENRMSSDIRRIGTTLNAVVIGPGDCYIPQRTRTLLSDSTDHDVDFNPIESNATILSKLHNLSNFDNSRGICKISPNIDQHKATQTNPDSNKQSKNKFVTNFQNPNKSESLDSRESRENMIDSFQDSFFSMNYSK